MSINIIENNKIDDYRIVPIEQIQDAIDEGLEGYIDYQNGSLIYKAYYINRNLKRMNPQTINVMTNNPFRKKFLDYLNESTASNHCFNFPLVNNEEIQAEVPDIIAVHKTLLSPSTPALGIDSLTSIPFYGPVPKPTDFNQITHNFRLIGDQKDPNNEERFYFINSSAALQVDNSTYIGKSCMIISLSLNSLNRLATTEGFEEYLTIADYYQDKSTDPSFASSLLKVGGGITLPVLMKMQAVISINGIPLSSPRIEKALYCAYKTALIGGGDSTFDIIFGQQSRHFVNNWNLLINKVNQLLHYYS